MPKTIILQEKKEIKRRGGRDSRQRHGQGWLRSPTEVAEESDDESRLRRRRCEIRNLAGGTRAWRKATRLGSVTTTREERVLGWLGDGALGEGCCRGHAMRKGWMSA